MRKRQKTKRERLAELTVKYATYRARAAYQEAKENWEEAEKYRDIAQTVYEEYTGLLHSGRF